MSLKDIKNIAKRLRTKSEEYARFANRERDLATESGDPGEYRQRSLDASRYEGESIGLRWAAEDLEKLLARR